ncbi:hypothetical protein SLS63_000525 [Diaporthe eres]|uniref:Cytochrome P450 n=1 Tax=Diaporthe eres TaxID=83184 RepID=A0ABR1PR07_DIAER
MKKIWAEDVEIDERALHEKHGLLVRIAYDEVSCSDPEAIHQIYRYSNALDKARLYGPYNTTGFSKHGDVFSKSSDKEHGQRRRIINNVYSMSNVSKGEQYVDICSKLFIQRLGEYADQSTACDFGEWIHWYTFDVLGELYYGEMFGFMKDREDHNNWIWALDKMIPFVCFAGVTSPLLRPLVYAAMAVLPLGKQIGEGSKNIAESSSRLMEERFDGRVSTERQDMAHQIFQIYKEKGEKVDFGWGDVQQESFGALFAGSDTTAISFRSLFYHLMHTPAAYEKLQAEIDQAFEDGRLSEMPTFQEASKLPYLDACIKEGLRVYPGAQLSLPRIVPKEGMTLCGKFIPGGYIVGCNAAVVQQDKKIFGEDAASFNPDRWLDHERANHMDKYMMAFGFGTRTCLGKNIARIQLYKLSPLIIRNFKLEFWDPNKTEWHTRNTFFARQEGIITRVTRRNY